MSPGRPRLRLGGRSCTADAFWSLVRSRTLSHRSERENTRRKSMRRPGFRVIGGAPFGACGPARGLRTPPVPGAGVRSSSAVDRPAMGLQSFQVKNTLTTLCAGARVPRATRESGGSGPPGPESPNDDFRSGKSLAFSGSDQAQKGRLVDALAARGDEGRDTLR